MRAGGSAIETEVLQGVYSRGLFGAGAAAELSLQQLQWHAWKRSVNAYRGCRARARERRRAARAGGNPVELWRLEVSKKISQGCCELC